MFNIMFSRIIRRLKYYKMFYSKHEIIVSKGDDNPDKTFYVIGIDYDTQGLMAIVKNTLSHIEYAKEKGYIPVVDMQHFKSQFGDCENDNVWEIFFKQPQGVSLEDIKRSRNIIHSRNVTTWLGYSIFPSILEKKNVQQLKRLRLLYKEYIVPSNRLNKVIEEKYNQTIGEKRNVLGVLCRGSDYTQKKPSGHAVQPTFEQIKEKVDEYIGRYTVDYLFVATEDEEYMNKFKSVYGEKVLCVEQNRFGKLKVNYISELNMAYNDLIEMNMNYYTSLYILSKCDYFISGMTAGTIGVAFMADGFKAYYYFELGHYK